MGEPGRVVSVAQMREADRRCIEDLGIPGAVLMNAAGMAVFYEVFRGPVGVVCGKGNNGGDGFVVARLALCAGFETRVLLIGRKDDVRGDARLFLEVYERLGGVVEEAPTEAEAAHAVAALADCGILIDAMLGTGVRGPVRGPLRAAIDAWPAVFTIAVDVPSGLNADTGEACGAAVAAEVTVTFQYSKRGYSAPSAQRYLGRLVVADIGIPPVCADDDGWKILGLGRSA